MEKRPIFFAPIQGYTDAIYRNVFFKYFGGVKEFYMPFLRIEHGKFRKREIFDMDSNNENNKGIFNYGKDIRLVPQIIGCEGDELKILIDKVVSLGYNCIDLNLGCPFPMLIKRGKGAALLKDPIKIESVLKVLSDYTNVEFSIKMRLGLEDKNECINILPILNSFNIRRIVMHPRIATQQYKGNVDNDAFESFCSKCKHPLVYNGDLTTLDEINTVFDIYNNIEGVMIGRGLLINPALALEYYNGEALDKNILSNKVKSFHQELFEKYSLKLQGGESQLLKKMQTIWNYLLNDMNHKQYKNIHKAGNILNYKNAVDKALALYGK